MWVMGHHEHAHSGFRQLAHARKHDLLVAEIQTGGWLVHDDKVGLLGKTARD